MPGNRLKVLMDCRMQPVGDTGLEFQRGSMLSKPKQNTNGTTGKGCMGCPYWGDGKGFVPDLINDQAPVFIVAQNPVFPTIGWGSQGS